MVEPIVLDRINFLGGVVIELLAVWIALLRPRTKASLAFTVLLAGFGGGFVINGIEAVLRVEVPGETAVRLVFYAAWIVGIALVAAVFPRPLASQDRGAVGAALALFALLTAVAILNALDGNYYGALLAGTSQAERDMRQLATRVASASMYAAMLLFALRFRKETDASNRSALALTAAAISIYFASLAGSGGYGYPSPVFAQGLDLVGIIGYLVATGACVAAWLFATAGPGARLARNVALVMLVLVLYGIVAGAHQFIAGGLNRVGMALVLTYAILRHQILGIDTKVRFAISKSTIAAIFIAVFFVASELAQQFFSDRTSSTYIGIGIAGTLVFAMAPMQRMAEKLAEKAVPVQPTAVMESRIATAGSEREESFRRAVRLALRDRRMTRDEERDLLELAHHLGISPLRAGRIQDEIADEPKARLTRRGHA